MNDVLVKPEPRSRTKRRRMRRARRVLGRTFGIAIVAGAVAAAAILLAQRGSAPEAPVVGSGDGDQLTVLVASTDPSQPSSQAESLTLFAVDRSGGDPSALFIPVTTYGQIPGQSSIEHVGKALIFGRESLQQTTIENLLGIAIDQTVVLDDVMLAHLVEALGGVHVEVDEAIYETDAAGNRELAFAAGPQSMDGPQAVTFLTYRAEGETELDRFVRAQRFWEAVFEAAGDEQTLTDGLATVTGLDAGDAAALGGVLDAIAGGAATFDVLAVQSAGGAGGSYSVDPAALDEQIAGNFAGSLPPLAIELGTRPRVELRNGVGAPEVGGTAAALLVPEGFKIEVTGNTAEFGNSSTRIIVYGEDEASLALAERARDVLGVGNIEIGTRGQTVVDLTIVLGNDFV